MLFLSGFAFGQTQDSTMINTSNLPIATKPEKQIDLSLEGMIALSVGDGIVGINVGGPSLKLKINSFKISRSFSITDYHR